MTDREKADLAAQEKLVPTEPNVIIQTGSEAKPTAATSSNETSKKDPKVIAAALICGSVTTLVFLTIASAIPILQIVVGWRYADQCPINWRIPHYSFIAGILGLVTIGLAILQAVLAIVLKSKMNRNEDLSGGLVAISCTLCGIAGVVVFLLIFLFGWFIAGCIWVFSVWSRVQYDDPAEPNYCHGTLYRVTFWLLFLSIIYQLYSCIRSSRQTAVQAKNVKQQKSESANPTAP